MLGLGCDCVMARENETWLGVWAMVSCNLYIFTAAMCDLGDGRGECMYEEKVWDVGKVDWELRDEDSAWLKRTRMDEYNKKPILYRCLTL